MCQLYNAELNKYLKQLTSVAPKCHNVKQAAECLGWQPGSCVWVMNEVIHLDETVEPIPICDLKVFWAWLHDTRTVCILCFVCIYMYIALCCRAKVAHHPWKSARRARLVRKLT